MFNIVFFGSNGKALASKIDVSSLLMGDGLYYGSTQLSSKNFANEFASIVSGRYMFASSSIKTFSGSLASLQDGTMMFQWTGSLTSFTSEMPNLSNGTYMFYNTPLLASFSSSLPNLRIGEYMFQNAIALPSFSVPLPKLTNGLRMFDGCTSLETFDSVLPSLENGSYMFQGCKLSGRSVRNIVESLPTHETQHSITIGINCTEDIEGQREFLRETGYNTFEEIEDALVAKGWKVVWHFQGFPSGYRPVEYLESTGTQIISLPFESKGKEFSCEHVAGMPTKTSGLYVYGGTAVSNGYGWRYYASNQSLSFSQQNKQYYSYARGSKHKILWMCEKNGSTFNLSMTADGKLLEQVTQNFNQYWENVYNVFGTTKYNTLIGGTTYELTISIDGECTCHVIPAIDTTTGAPCMYDIISRTPFYNEGAGDFIYPNIEMQASTYSIRNKMYGQMTKHGIRRLYHLPYDYEGTLEEFIEENGFKQLVENEKPEEGNWMPEWTETEDAIVLNWVEAPKEPLNIAE